MLRKIKGQAQGLRFYEVLSDSPLTVLYQCIGNVKSAQIEDTLKAEVSGSADASNAVPVSFRVKNTLASATGRPDVAACLQATNVLVGWNLQSASTTEGLGRSALRVVKESDRLSQIVAEASAASAAAAQGPRRQPPQRTLSVIIKASLRLGEKYPVAPLAGFFHGQRIRLADLARWSELDDMTVYSELIGQLDSVPHGLVQSVSFGDGGLSALLDSQSGPLVALLEARKAESSPSPAAAS